MPDRPTVTLARSDQTGIQSGKPLSAVLTDSRLRLLRKDGYSYGNTIDGLLERIRPTQVVTTAHNRGMLRLIYNRRADYFFIAEEEAHFLTVNSGVPLEALEVVTFADMPNGNQRYIMFTRRVETSTIERLNRVIEHICIE